VTPPVSLDAETPPAPASAGPQPARGVRVLRLGVVSFLNAAPLVHGLEGDRSFELQRELPSRVAERLHAGEIELGTIPSIEYARGDYAIVPGVAIASRGPVRSVCLFLKRPLPDVRRVALDGASRTSVALLKVLLKAELGREPEYVVRSAPIPDMLTDADAALAIGDPALYFDGEAVRLDLGAWWTDVTGHPFVWAFWAGRPGVISGSQVARLQSALADGQRCFAAIAEAWGAGSAARAALNDSYLRENMLYALGAAEQAGLSEFYRRAHAAGLIERRPELRFHGAS